MCVHVCVIVFVLVYVNVCLGAFEHAMCAYTEWSSDDMCLSRYVYVCVCMCVL